MIIGTIIRKIGTIMALEVNNQLNSKYRKAKITTRLVENLKIGEVVSDTHLPGFCVRCQKLARIYFVRKYANGRRHFVSIGEHAVAGLTERKARDKAQEIIISIRQGENPTAERTRINNMPTLSEYAEQFFQEHGKKLKTSTLRDYKSIFRTHVSSSKLGKLKLHELKKSDLANLHTRMHTKKRTANKVLQIISSIYREAEQAGLIEKNINPTKGIKHYKIEARQRFLSQDELINIGQVLSESETDNSENIYAITAIRLLIYTGARLNEILTLRWEWVDLEHGYLYLPDSKTGQKVIHLSTPAQDLLSNLPKIKGNPYVIVGEKEGSHWVNLRKPWERIKKKAGIKPTTLPNGSKQHVRIHDLRHNFASLAASGGASLLMIGALLGHRQVSTTARYAHLTDDPLKDVNNAAGKTAAKALLPLTKSNSTPR